jgi:p-aminobenzoyl-glutamate transporter AbgT
VDIGAFESQGFTITVVGGASSQSGRIGKVLARPLAVIVKPKLSLEPVNGGVVFFTVQSGGTGASATLSSTTATIAGGTASVTATANPTRGTYTVSASTGASSASFLLKNV